MGNIVFLVIMVPVSLLFTCLGVYAWRRKKPMWFWSGSTVREEEISDVAGYNRANGCMWLAFSGIVWASTFLGALNVSWAGIFLIVGCGVGVLALPIVYGKIYARYRKK